MKTLSIRQPWAWLIVNGHKDIENRSWATKIRGPVLIHASKSQTRDEYEDACVSAMIAGDFISRGIVIPAFEEIERGGIVGQATITGCVDKSPSPWFFGPQGFLLEDAKPLQFRPCKGALGFFNAEP